MKFKKYFGLGLLTVALSLFVMSCAEDDDEKESTFKVTLTNSYFDEYPNVSSAFFDAGERVGITSDCGPDEFLRWESTPANIVSPDDAWTTWFVMPGRDATIRSVCGGATYYDGDAYVRFAWETSWQPLVQYIYASAQDIQYWYDNIFDDLDIGDDDFVARPSFTIGTPGLAGLPADARPLLGLMQPATKNPNNGKEFKVADGNYIAVCSVEDADFPDVIWEIIADYSIIVNKATGSRDGEDSFFELGFWMTDFFSDDPQNVDPQTGLSWGWYGLNYEDGDAPRLSKSRREARRAMVATKKVEKAGATMDVTYYAFPRAKK